MDKFYPKDFVLWRPQLLLLLIFLEVVYDCTGNGRGLAQAARVQRGNGGYKDYCKQDSSCQEEFVCDPIHNECACRNFHSSKLTLFYDKKHGKCFSAVGKLCSLEADGLWKIECVPYSECARPGGVGRNSIPDVFGVCTCKPGFEETKEHICKPAMVIQIGNGDHIFTMARVGMKEGEEGLSPETPIEDNMIDNQNEIIVDEKDRQKDSKATKPPPVIPYDQDNDNANLDLAKSTLDNWETFDPTSSAAREGGFVTCLTFLVVIAIINVHFSCVFLCSS